MCADFGFLTLFVVVEVAVVAGGGSLSRAERHLIVFGCTIRSWVLLARVAFTIIVLFYPHKNDQLRLLTSHRPRLRVLSQVVGVTTRVEVLVPPA
jgi:hypothetical protein